MRRRSLLAASLLAVPPLLAPRAWGADDLRAQLNPALARASAEDPDRAGAVLDALDAIVRGRPIPPPPPKTRGHLDEGTVRGLLEENPLLREAWRIDPKAALAQIQEIVAIGGE